MLAVLLALTAAISFGCSDYVAGRAARRAGTVVSVAFTAEVAKAVLVILVVPFVSSKNPSAPSLAWGAAAGVSGGVGEMALYLGFRHAAFSVVSSVSAVGAAMFPVLAGFLFGERPGAFSLVGIALTLPAIMALSARPGKANASKKCERDAATSAPGGTNACNPVAYPNPEIRKGPAAGVVWGLAAGAGFGLSLIGLNRAGSRTDLWPLAIAELAAVAIIACTAAAIGELKLPPTGTRRLSALTGIMGSLGIFSYFLSTHRGLLVVTAVIYSLYPAATILLAKVLSGERLTSVRIIGLCLAAVSVGLIAVGVST
jgi:drug/metabolite transporter (DMT)-like permease